MVRRVGLAVFLLLALSATAAAGQALSIKAEPRTESVLCDLTEPPPTCGVADPAEVETLVNAATQALILGDLAEADRYLTQALELNPCAVEATYLRGRITAQTQSTGAANEWFCRYLALAPLGASASEARRRLSQAMEEGAGASIMARFREGVTRYRQGRMEAAETAFTAVLEQHPVPEALYNRALVRLATDRPAEAIPDLRSYLEMVPEGEEQPAIRRALRVPASGWAPRNPGTAFMLGAVFPGGGQYYTGRTWYGLTVTALVAGSVASGLLYQRTTIQCRSPDPTGQCPPDAIAGTETSRPLLLPALGAGAAIMLVTAVEAAINAGGREPPLTVATGVGGWTVEIAARPVPAGAGAGIRLLQLRH